MGIGAPACHRTNHVGWHLESVQTTFSLAQPQPIQAVAIRTWHTPHTQGQPTLASTPPPSPPAPCPGDSADSKDSSGGCINS